MMKSLISFIFIALLSFLLPLSQCATSPSAAPPAIGGNLIVSVCKKTPYYDLCVSSLTSNPKSANADLLGLAHIIVDIVTSNATNTLNYIQELIKNNKDPDLGKQLIVCSQLYSVAVYTYLPLAHPDLKKGDYYFAKLDVFEASYQAQSCEQRFGDHGLKSPLTDKNKIVQDLGDVGQAIVAMLGS